MAATCMAVPSAYSAITVPGAPTGVTGIPRNAAEGVNWAAPSSNGGKTITGYTAEAALVGASSGKTCHTKRARTCRIIGLLNGYIYNITVRASNIMGEGPASAPIQVTPGIPGTPTYVTVTPGNGYVPVSWNAVKANGSRITRYTVTSSPEAKNCATSGATYCTVTGLTNGTPYTFTVTATNARGTGASSAPSAAVTPFIHQTIPVGRDPWDVSSDGTHVWVANQNDNTVTELNASNGSLVQTIPVGINPVAISSDRTHVWVGNWGGNTVTELNASNGSLVQTIPVGPLPLAVSSDGTHVWVANSSGNTVTELNASDGSLVQTIYVGSTPYAISSDGTHVWVTNESADTIRELNASDGSLVQTIAVGTSPRGVSSDGTHVWVTSFYDNTVRELNASDGSLVQTIPVGALPLGASSDGTHVWVGNYGRNTVTELNASDGSLVQIIFAGGVAQAVSSDGTDVWVANSSGNTVTEFPA